MIAVSVHEFAHGWVAYKLGDNTAKSRGRLSLNPLAHVDPMGTLILPLLIFIGTQGRFIFGAAKPVPVNFSALRNPKRDMIWIGLSGPAANFLFAIFLSMIASVKLLPPAAVLILHTLILINVVLGVFNLVPIPPLDGSRVIMGLLPNSLARAYVKIEPYGFFIVILLIYLGLLNSFVWPVVNRILGMLL